MKSRIKETGSAAHIVIIVILVVAILGALGFIFWQNFINKPASSNESTQQPQQSQQAATNTTLSIADLGIAITYPTEEDVYSTLEASKTSASIRSQKAAEACKTDGNIGYIFTFPANEEAEGSGTAAKDYYIQGTYQQVVTKGNTLYVFRSPQGVCTDPRVAGGDEANTLAENAYLSFARHFQDLDVIAK